MIILKPAITYVGEGETRKPTVSRDCKKYTPEDLMFFGTYLATLEDNDTVDTEADVDNDSDEEDDDLLSLLNDLD